MLGPIGGFAVLFARGGTIDIVLTGRVMRFTKAIIISCIVAGLVIGGMFALQSIMFVAASHWAERGFDIPVYQRIAYAIAVWWSRFWWLASPLLVGLVFICVLAVYVSLGSIRRVR